MPDVTAWVIGIPSNPQKPIFKSKEGPARLAQSSSCKVAKNLSKRWGKPGKVQTAGGIHWKVGEWRNRGRWALSPHIFGKASSAVGASSKLCGPWVEIS